ncbi:hypothetical protein GUJ93_ZPchr0004g38602 [Zizania palustris]|uniref:TF-B3 domain-containing protein n=1 Tax=Zizania palustris TaxID=103762 RepID=A0A8J5T1S7_ZIZPA|nr:hypothetical protein GUJ93_ZPchr0004g38602 [Zizania palustris]
MADAKGSASSSCGGGAGHGDFVGGGGQRRYLQGIHAVVHRPGGVVVGRHQNVHHHLYPAGVIHPPPTMTPVQVPLPYVSQLTFEPPQHRAQSSSSSQMPSHETIQHWNVCNNRIIAAPHDPRGGFQDWRISNRNGFYPNLTPCSISSTAWTTNNNSMAMNNSAYTSYPPATEDHQSQSFHNSNHGTINSGFIPANYSLDTTFVPASSFQPITSSSQCFSSTQISDEPTNAKKVKTSDAKEPPRVFRSSDMESEKSDELLDHTPVGELTILNQNQKPLIGRFNCREYSVVLRKDLTNSDVSNIGRIVMPKRDAEAHLPPLPHREGVVLVMDDFKIATTWNFKYRFWPNNKSRMYVLESTGVFVKEHGLQTGDTFIIYKNSETGKFLVRGEKSIKPDAVMPVVDCICKEEVNSNEECRFAISLQSRRT